MAKRIYWDADVYISYLGNTPGRIETVSGILKQAQDNDQPVYTSAFTRVEVAFVEGERDDGLLKEDAERLLDNLWEDRKITRIIEISSWIERKARELMRAGMQMGVRRLKPADAIHLASAEFVKVDELHTYNMRDFQPYEDLVYPRICEPNIARQMRFSDGSTIE